MFATHVHTSIFVLRAVEGEGLEHYTCTDQGGRQQVTFRPRQNKMLVADDHEWCVFSAHTATYTGTHTGTHTANDIHTDTYDTGAVVELVHEFDPVQTESVQES